MMRRFLLGALVLSSLLAPHAARAEIPRKDPPPGDTLQAVLDRIHKHAESDAWKEPGFRDDAIEAWLDKLVGSVAKTADIPDLKLPVRLAEVKSGDQPMGRTRSGSLIIGKNVELKFPPLSNCVVFADGDVDVLSAEGCVIVARGTVTVLNSQRSVIVGGTLVKVQSDGRPTNNESRSLVVSRGWIDMESSAYGTILSANEGMNVNRFEGAVFLNAPVPPIRFDPRRGSPSRSVTVRDLPLERLPVHPLSERISLIGVLHRLREEPNRFGRTSTFGPTGIVFRLDNRKYVAELGRVVVDESEKPLEAFSDFKLTQLTPNVAILSGSESDAVVQIANK